MRRTISPGGGLLRRGTYCLPSLVIIGAQKSGTTALAALLSQNPSILMAAGKETHFFDHKSPKASLSGYLALLPRLETDAQAFADSNNHDWPKADTSRAITAEATPAYLPWRSAVDGLLTVSPRAKLVAVVREPAQRFYSEWHMKARRVAQQEEGLMPAALAQLSRGMECCVLWVANAERSAREQDGHHHGRAGRVPGQRVHAPRPGHRHGAQPARPPPAGSDGASSVARDGLASELHLPYEHGRVSGALCDAWFGAAAPVHTRSSGELCGSSMLGWLPAGRALLHRSRAQAAVAKRRVGECLEAAADASSGVEFAAQGGWVIAGAAAPANAAAVNGHPARAAAAEAAEQGWQRFAGHRCLGSDVVPLEAHLSLRDAAAVGAANVARCLAPCGPDAPKTEFREGHAPAETPKALVDRLVQAAARRRPSSLGEWQGRELSAKRWRKAGGAAATALLEEDGRLCREFLRDGAGQLLVDAAGKPLAELDVWPAGSGADCVGEGCEGGGVSAVEVVHRLCRQADAAVRVPSGSGEVGRPWLDPLRVAREWAADPVQAASAGAVSMSWDAATAAGIALGTITNTTDLLRGGRRLVDASMRRFGSALGLAASLPVSSLASAGLPSWAGSAPAGQARGTTSHARPASTTPTGLLSGGASDHICVSSPGWGKALDALGARPFASDRARAAIAKAEAAGGNASLALLWGAREDCWPLGTGMNIAVDEVARSLFAEQLLIAASAAGPENVLLLEQSALRNDESKALQRVLKLVGLGWSQSPASPSQPSFEEAWADQATVLAGNETATNRGGGSDTAQIVSKVFARFHNNGWAAKGSYPPMPQDLEGRLRHFFAPFNRGLDQIAGVVRG